MSSKTMEKELIPRLGEEMGSWIIAEVKDNIAASKQKRRKAYWLPPDPQVTTHDPRGIASYIGAENYVSTPGDKYERNRSRMNENS